MRTLPCITFRVLFDQRPAADTAPRVRLLGDHGAMDVLSSRVLLHPTDPERSRVFYRDTLGLAIYREFGSSPERGVVAAGAPAGHHPTGARRAWRVDPAGAQAGAVGAAGDVDRRPRWDADLHR